jgi:hypothetical protein
MIAMPPLIPSSEWNGLSLAIARGAADQVQTLVEENFLDVNAFLDSSSWMPVLMDVLISNGFDTEEDRLRLLRYLLQRGANPNICCSRGYNCLHIAVQQDKYLKALDLFLDFNPDVNIGDADGANIIYWAIQQWLFRKEGAHRAENLRVLEKIVRLGADLDQKNNFGMSAREWLGHAPADVKALVSRCEEKRHSVHAVRTIQPVLPIHLQYPEVAQQIWKELVPATGPAATIQGELLRSVEALRDEAQHNGNANFGRSYKRMAASVRDTLVRSGIFDADEVRQIKIGTAKLMKASRPYKNDDVYDLLVDKVCVFHMKHKTQVARGQRV